MALTDTRAAFVNRSSTAIEVYDGTTRSPYHTGTITVGGNVIGKIYPDECYTVIPHGTYCTYEKIIFRDKNGDESYGYIEASPGYSLPSYDWVEYQEPYHYYNSNGSKLVTATTQVISGKTQYIFTVQKAVTYRNPQGTNLGTLAVGTQLATDCSTTGLTYGSYMVFNKKNTGSGWVNLCTTGYGFVDLGFNVGSKATNRAIY
jgi:hypothetical protein